MNIYDEFFSIIKQLNAAGIKYALVGGIALSFYVEPRYTKDIDLLVLSNRIDELKSILKNCGYTFQAHPCTFRNTNLTMHRLSKLEEDDSLTIDLLEAGDEQHVRIIENAVIENTEYGPVSIATRPDLIRMKKLRNSKQDIADIEALEDDQN